MDWNPEFVSVDINFTHMLCLIALSFLGKLSSPVWIKIWVWTPGKKNSLLIKSYACDEQIIGRS